MITFVIFLPIIILAGVGGIVGGSFIISDLAEYDHFFDLKMIAMPIAMILAGLTVLAVTILGCCGALKESSTMLICFSLVLGLVFLLELAIGISAVVMRIDLSDYLQAKLQRSMDSKTTEDMKAWDILQRRNHCCGIEGAKDWYDSNAGKIPSSCCRPNLIDINTKNCLNSPPILKDRYFVDGCLLKLHRKVADSEDILIGVGIGSAFVQVLGIILACLFSQSL